MARNDGPDVVIGRNGKMKEIPLPLGTTARVQLNEALMERNRRDWVENATLVTATVLTLISQKKNII
jgi:hypothetical protein